MTYVLGLVILLLGGIAFCLTPANRVAVPLLVGGMIVIVLRMTGAIAADLPVPPPGVTVKQMRAAIADHDRRKRASPKRFRDMLSSPIGEGRME